MRILHTSDWHIGRRLGRHDRTPEFRDVLDEVVRIATDADVDLVLLSGDLFDRAMPTVDALGLALDALQRLADVAPVVCVAGNHDSPELFDALAPFLRDRGRGVHLVGSIRRPEEAVLRPDVLGIPAAVACFPFLREGRVVDFMREAGEWYRAYADRIAAIAAAYNRVLVEAAGNDAVPLLVAHFMVSGVRVSRSERELHIGEAYSATAQSIPAGPQYVAMGHIHAPQAVPGAGVPAHYAGSLLPLDFGEAGERKRVLLVEAEPGRLATVQSVPLRSGRPLRRESGTWEELVARGDELRDAYLDLTVDVGGVDPDLGRRATETFPYLVHVRPRRPEGPGAERRDPQVRPRDDELYAAFVRRSTGEDPPEDLLALFREVLEETVDAPA
jgi:exonuclease SbcD